MAGQCEYSESYSDLISGEPKTYKCHRDAIPGSRFCLFHDERYWSEHEEEVRGEFFKELEAAKGGVLLAIGYHLPEIELRKGLECDTYFHRAVFHGPFIAKGIDFSRVMVIFENATFEGYVGLSKAKFKSAAFSESTFNELADFSGATFNEPAAFSESTFNEPAVFSGATFKFAFFPRATFNKSANFFEATFNELADFSGATFKFADFSKATFNKSANFFEATFNEQVYFNNSTFAGPTTFEMALFKGAAEFEDTVFLVPYGGILDQTKRGGLFKKIITVKGTTVKCKFEEDHEITITRTDKESREEIKRGNEFEHCFGEAGVYKIRCILHKEEEGEIEVLEDPNGIILFYKSRAEEPQMVLFDRVNLVRVLLLNFMGLDRIRLLNVEFGGADRIVTIEEETFRREGGKPIKDMLGALPTTLEGVTRDDVLWVYRKLRDCYEGDARYADAGRAFISEMEVRRLYRKDGRANPSYVRWLSPLALYKWLANYGESYMRPLLLSASTILGFAAVRWLAGLPAEDALDALVDSLAAFFQIPRGSGNADILERILSAPILAALIIALRRNLERRFRR